MIIEVRNVHDRNKGAELMLRAIVDHYASRDDVTLTANHRVGDRKRLARLGIRPLLFVWMKRGFLAPPASLVPRSVRRAMGVVHPEEVDLVVDAAGFAYGEQWGTDRAVHAAKYYRYLRDRGAKVVLMPQSLGPFTSADVRRTAEALFAQADAIFPRDDTAAAEVRELLDDDPRVVQSPDFTPLISGMDGPQLPAGDKPAAIIPNRKMIQKGGLTEEQYVSFLVDVYRAFAELGYTPFMLPHATFDHDLAAAVDARIDGTVPVLVEPDALRLKGVIGRCHAIFSSRFHGLVSGLSQGVPSLGTGWSHKYEHLFAEYCCPSALIDATRADSLEGAVSALLVGERYAATRTTLRERAAWHKEQVGAMWERVDALLGTD